MKTKSKPNSLISEHPCLRTFLKSTIGLLFNGLTHWFLYEAPEYDPAPGITRVPHPRRKRSEFRANVVYRASYDNLLIITEEEHNKHWPNSGVYLEDFWMLDNCLRDSACAYLGYMWIEGKRDEDWGFIRKD